MALSIVILNATMVRANMKHCGIRLSKSSRILRGHGLQNVRLIVSSCPWAGSKLFGVGARQPSSRAKNKKKKNYISSLRIFCRRSAMNSDMKSKLCVVSRVAAIGSWALNRWCRYASV